jgi:hypothetical protein
MRNRIIAALSDGVIGSNLLKKAVVLLQLKLHLVTIGQF